MGMEGLVERLKRRDEKAFEAVMGHYKDPLFRFLLSMVVKPDLAEELTQETFVRLYFHVNSLKSDFLKAWLYRVAGNLARQEFRKRKLLGFFSFEREEEAPGVMGDEEAINLRRMIDTLPGPYRVPFVLKEVEEWSFEEIAETLGKPVGTVKSLVSRAREKLKGSEKQENIHEREESHEG